MSPQECRQIVNVALTYEATQEIDSGFHHTFVSKNLQQLLTGRLEKILAQLHNPETPHTLVNDTFHLISYEKGRGMEWHTDDHFKNKQKETTGRHSIVMHLNKCEGGAFEIVDKDTGKHTVVQPETGNCIVFDNDNRHRVQPCLTPRWSLVVYSVFAHTDIPKQPPAAADTQVDLTDIEVQKPFVFEKFKPFTGKPAKNRQPKSNTRQ